MGVVFQAESDFEDPVPAGPNKKKETTTGSKYLGAPPPVPQQFVEMARGPYKFSWAFQGPQDRPGPPRALSGPMGSALEFSKVTPGAHGALEFCARALVGGERNVDLGGERNGAVSETLRNQDARLFREKRMH